MYLKIEENEEFLLFIKDLKKIAPEWVAIDTEFQRESTFYPILSLIQIATENKTWVIDAINCGDISPLKKILESKKIKKIFHAGDQDWAILRQTTGAICAPFFDTQIMASFAKLGNSLGLENLVSQVLATPVDKSQQKTDWIKRPLSDHQLEYAARDAAYVAKIYPILLKKLEDLDRDTWITEEMATLLKKYKTDSISRDWLSFCHTGCKWPVPLYALELAKWREDLAKKLDIPKRHVIGDLLLEKAARDKNIRHINETNCSPGTLADLRKYWAKVSPKTSEYSKKRYSIMLKVKNHHQEFSPEKIKLLKKLQKKIKQIAEELGIPPHMLLNKQQTYKILAGQIGPTNGWRKKHLKDFIMENVHTKKLQGDVEMQNFRSATND